MGEGALFLKYSTLLVITVQTSAMVLLLRYSRRQSIDPADAYVNSTAVFFSELIKFVICIVVIAWKGMGHHQTLIIAIYICVILFFRFRFCGKQHAQG